MSFQQKIILHTAILFAFGLLYDSWVNYNSEYLRHGNDYDKGVPILVKDVNFSNSAFLIQSRHFSYPVLIRGFSSDTLTKKRINSLKTLEKHFGNVKSEIELKGLARKKGNKGSLGEHEEWIGLKEDETLKETIAYVNKGESQGNFGSLRSIVYKRENELSKEAFECLYSYSNSSSGIKSGQEAYFGEKFRSILPSQISPLQATSLWLRKVEKEADKSYNPIGYHAHIDSGFYYHLFGKKSFSLLPPSALHEMEATRHNRWDIKFPLVFGNETYIYEMLHERKFKSMKVELLPGDILFQPAWVFHQVEYGQGEHASIRLGYVYTQTLLQDPFLALKCIPGFLNAAVELMKQKVF